MPNRSATSEGRATTIKIVRQETIEVFVPFIVGGEVRQVQDVRPLLIWIF